MTSNTISYESAKQLPLVGNKNHCLRKIFYQDAIKMKITIRLMLMSFPIRSVIVMKAFQSRAIF